MWAHQASIMDMGSRLRENVILYNVTAYKLTEIDFPFDLSDYNAPWQSESLMGALKYTSPDTWSP